MARLSHVVNLTSWTALSCFHVPCCRSPGVGHSWACRASPKAHADRTRRVSPIFDPGSHVALLPVEAKRRLAPPAGHPHGNLRFPVFVSEWSPAGHGALHLGDKGKGQCLLYPCRPAATVFEHGSRGKVWRCSGLASPYQRGRPIRRVVVNPMG